jgi:hypothetical protein
MASLASMTELLDRAHRETGIGAFDGDSHREGLAILLKDSEAHGKLTDPGAIKLEDTIVQYLRLRLKVEQYAREHPEVRDVPIVAPVIVMGMPRTGTTLLSNLLATDRSRRSLTRWQAFDPVPPPEADQLFTDPRALALLEIERKAREANPSGGRYYRGSTVYPTECVHVHGQDFKSLFWDSSGRLPNHAEFMLHVDMTSAYDYHRLFLQVLQHKAKGPWNLKMPSHALHIRWLLKAYPDARMIWTHRDPYTAVGSCCSLIAFTHTWYLDEPDREWIGGNYPAQMAEHIKRTMAVRGEIGHDRIYDSYYADTMRDPIGSMRDLYAWLGDEFTPTVEAGIREWVSENPQGKFGAHEYKLGEYGLSVEKLRPLFADYLDAYKVESEGKGQA